MKKRELMIKIENYLRNQNKRFFDLSNDEIFDMIEFKFMRDIFESSKESDFNENIEIDIFEKIQLIRNEKLFKDLNYYSLNNFKNILHKRLNMRIFYYQSDENEYHLYLSFNLNDRRFKNEKKILDRIELIKILNHYSRKEREMKIS